MLTPKHFALALCAAGVAVTVVITASAPAAAPQRRTRARPAPNPNRTAQADQPAQPTHIQVDVFEVVFESHHLRGQDRLTMLRGAADSRPRLMKRLAELGPTRVLALTDNVIDLAGSAEWNHGRRAPVISDIVTGKDGKRTPSINYHQMGFSAEIRGQWDTATTPATARLACDISLNGVLPSGVELSPNLDMPAFGKLNIEQTVVVESGQAALLIGNETPLPEDKDRIRASIVRVEATRLTDLESPASTEPGAEAGPIAAPTRVRIDCYELSCDPRRLVEIESTIDQAPGDVLGALRSMGTVRTIGFVENIVDLSRSSKLTSGCNLPVVQDVAVSAAGVVTPSVSYANVGIQTELSGRWRKTATGEVADIRCEFEFSEVTRSPQKRVKDQVALPEFPQFSISQRLTLAEGRPAWLMSTAVPLDDNGKTTGVTAIRIEASRVPGAGSQLDDEAKSAAVQATHLQLELYQLDGNPDECVPTVTDLQRHAGSSAGLVGRLEAIGTTRLLGTIENIFDLTKGAEYQRGQSVPVVVGTRVLKGGHSKASVNYKDVGLKVELNGAWRESEDAWADIHCMARYSGVIESDVETASDITLPGYLSFKTDQHLALADGHPVVLITSIPSGPDDSSEIPSVLVMRVAARPEGAASSSEKEK